MSGNYKADGFVYTLLHCTHQFLRSPKSSRNCSGRIVYGIRRIERAPQIRKHSNFILNLKINSNDYNKVII
jgi:hypothetical protein